MEILEATSRDLGDQSNNPESADQSVPLVRSLYVETWSNLYN